MSKIALVAGGAGNIGSAVVTALLESGEFKNVVVVSRSKEKINTASAAIRAKVGKAADNVIGIIGNIGDQSSCATLKNQVVEAVGDKLDIVVSSVGFPFIKYGALIDTTTAQIQAAYDGLFYAPFYAYQQFMPLVRNSSSGSYLFVTGGGTDMYLGPGTALMTIGGASTQALARSAMKEEAGTSVCCTEVSLNSGVCPNPAVMPPGYTWLPTAEVGKALVSVAMKRKADVRTITVKSLEDVEQLIANGVLGEANGSS